MRAALGLLLIAANAQRNKPQGVQLSSSPYDILGVHRRATVQEIRNAYRAKARETHPDKARPGREAEMRDRFLEVAAAFELLTDVDARRDFDSRGTYQRPTTKTYKRRTQKKHAPLTEEEERAAARVLNVRSRKHLEDAALGEDGRVDRHFVLALYDEGECEDYLTFTTRFPYPFADKLDPHGIWWEDVLQTAKTRLTDADGQLSRIAKKLNLDVRKGCPQVVFAGNGTDLFSDVDVVHRPTRQALEEWLWPKLQTRVRFENDSPHPVRTWWVHGGRAKDPMDVAPGASLERNAYVSHLFAVRDARAGGPLTKESCLNWQHVDSDADPFVIRASPKCQDWHGDCGAWGDAGECERNDGFMRKFCHRTCRGRDAARAALVADEAARRAAEAQAESVRLREAYEAAAADAKRLQDEAISLEIQAEASAVNALRCDATYPEKEVRRW